MNSRCMIGYKTVLAFVAICSCLLSCPAHIYASELTIHVTPGGVPLGNSSSLRPVTLAGARELLQKRTALERSEAATIILHGGTYPLDNPLAIGAAESGTAAAPVIWKAAGDGDVVFSGGITVRPADLRPVTDATTLNRLPARKEHQDLALFEITMSDLQLDALPQLNPRGFGRSLTAWPELFLDGQPLPLSAWPNGTGYSGGFKPTKIVKSGTNAKVIAAGASSTQNTEGDKSMAFTVKNDRFGNWQKAMELFHAEPWFGGHWFWDWADDFLPAAAISDDGTVRIGKTHTYGINSRANLHIYNLVEEMDAPGEYTLEPAQKRIFVLLPKATPPRNLVLSWSEKPLVLMKSASHVRFAGIRFAYGRSDGVRIDHGNNINFSRCTFVNLAANGCTAAGSQILLEDCLFMNIGAVGVSFSGGDSKSLTHADNRVAYCEFKEFGRLRRTYAPAVHLHGVGSTVENCLFYNAPHSAILFSGQEHLIRNNEIHHVLMETGDCGAIYSCRSWTTFGNVISGNYIHDLGSVVQNRQLGGRGIYLDDQVSGVTVKNNFVSHADLALLVGGGRHNTVTENILTHCNAAIQLDSRGAGWAKKNQSTLKAGLANIPATGEPWNTRYPMVKDILNNQPELPVGTIITNNAVIDCKKVWKDKSHRDVAIVDPNMDKLPPDSLQDQTSPWKINGTTLTFSKPKTGIRLK